MRQAFINTNGNAPTIRAYVPETILPIVFTTLNFTMDDINIETTTNADPMYPKISINIAVSIFLSSVFPTSYAKIGAKAAAKASFCACASAKSFPNVVKYVLIFGSVPDGRTTTVAPPSKP